MQKLNHKVKNNILKFIKNNVNILVFIFIFFLTFAPFLVSAWVPGEPIVPCGTKASPSDCSVCHIFVLGNNIVGFITVGLAMPFAVVMILWGGILMVTAGGDSGQLEKGKKYLTWAVIGLVVAFAGWIIVDTILKALTVKDSWGSSSWSLGPWYNLPSCSS